MEITNSEEVYADETVSSPPATFLFFHKVLGN